MRVEYPSEILHFYQPLLIRPLGAILTFTQAKRDVTLAEMTQPSFCLETPPSIPRHPRKDKFPC